MNKNKVFKPIQKRLQTPLFSILLILIIIFSLVIVNLQNKNVNKSSKILMETILAKLAVMIELQSESLSAIQLTLLKDTFTALEAERTGKLSSGIELGPFGTFTLRVVQPVYDNDTLIGYIELGKEIEDILSNINKILKVDFALTIHKYDLTRKTWESGMKMLNRDCNWDRFPKEVLIYSTISSIPDELISIISNEKHIIKAKFIEKKYEKKSYKIMAKGLIDVSGKNVGTLIIIQDITSIKTEQHRLIIFIITVALMISGILVIFLLKMLKQTDQYIFEQQENIRISEERGKGFINSATDSFVLFDEELNILQVNDIHLKMFHPEEDRKNIIGKNIKEIVPNIVQTGRFDEFIKVMKTNIPFTAEDIIPDKKFGEKYLSVRAFKMPMGLGVIIQDTTERKLFEESLRKSENKYRVLSENISDVIWIYNISKKKFSYISSSVFILRGFSPEEAMQQTLVSSLTPESAKKVNELIPQRIEKFLMGDNQFYKDEFQQKCKDGSFIWVEIITKFQYAEDKTLPLQILWPPKLIWQILQNQNF